MVGPDAGGAAPEQGSSLRDYLQIVRRRKWIVAQATLVVPVVAVVVSLRQTPVYQASAEVLSRPGQAATLSGAGDPTASQDPARLLQTQAELAATPRVARRVLRAVGLEDRTPADFLANAWATAKTNSNLLIFSAVDHDPRIAIALATAYGRQFTVYQRELETASLKKALRDVQARIARLEADDKADTPVYGNLVEREQQLGTLEAVAASNAVLVREATEAYRIKPRPKRNAALGLALGLFLGLCLAFLWEALDTRVRSTSEIERRLGLPLLARIPEPSRWLQRRLKLAMLAAPNSLEAEAFRVLRTNLDFFNMEHRARTIMITSAVQGEGKSTTVANLAIALSRAGQRVVLVDLDLRRPVLHKFFDLQGSVGLTDVTEGRARLTAASPETHGDSGRLEVLTTGPLPKHTGEFIGTPQLGRVLDELKERADVVLIDSPPLLAVGDAIALSGRVDGIILLTRLNVIRRSMLDELRRILSSCPAAKLGFVVTGAEVEEDYRYGYGYSYGYESRSEAQREPR